MEYEPEGALGIGRTIAFEYCSPASAAPRSLWPHEAIRPVECVHGQGGNDNDIRYVGYRLQRVTELAERPDGVTILH